METYIKNTFLENGAAVCGIADVETFSAVESGFRPRDVYSDCRSVAVFGVPIPKGTALVNPRIIYGHFNALAEHELDRIAFRAANIIEKHIPGAIVVPIPSDSPYEYWIPEKREGKGLVSMKHAAVFAGLGQLGKNTLLLNPTYGNMLAIGAVLLNLSLLPDPPLENICLPSCHLCVDSCPASAVHDGFVDQLLCRQQAYADNERGFAVVNCNRCRTSCPMLFGVPTKPAP